MALTAFGDGDAGDVEEMDEEEQRIEAALNGGLSWNWAADPDREDESGKKTGTGTEDRRLDTTRLSSAEEPWRGVTGVVPILVLDGALFPALDLHVQPGVKSDHEAYSSTGQRGASGASAEAALIWVPPAEDARADGSLPRRRTGFAAEARPHRDALPEEADEDAVPLPRSVSEMNEEDAERYPEAIGHAAARPVVVVRAPLPPAGGGMAGDSAWGASGGGSLARSGGRLPEVSGAAVRAAVADALRGLHLLPARAAAAVRKGDFQRLQRPDRLEVQLRDPTAIRAGGGSAGAATTQLVLESAEAEKLQSRRPGLVVAGAGAAVLEAAREVLGRAQVTPGNAHVLRDLQGIKRSVMKQCRRAGTLLDRAASPKVSLSMVEDLHAAVGNKDRLALTKAVAKLHQLSRNLRSRAHACLNESITLANMLEAASQRCVRFQASSEGVSAAGWFAGKYWGPPAWVSWLVTGLGVLMGVLGRMVAETSTRARAIVAVAS